MWVGSMDLFPPGYLVQHSSPAPVRVNSLLVVVGGQEADHTPRNHRTEVGHCTPQLVKLKDGRREGEGGTEGIGKTEAKVTLSMKGLEQWCQTIKSNAFLQRKS